MLSGLGRSLRTVYLARVALITLAVLYLLGPISIFIARSLLGNLLDQGIDQRKLFAVCLVSFLTSAVCLTCLNLVLYYGPERFCGGLITRSVRRQFLIFYGGLAASIVLVSSVCYATTQIGTGEKSVTALGAFGAAAIIVIACKMIQLVFTNPVVTPHPPPYLVFPGDRVPGLRSVFRYLYEAHPGWLDKLKGSSRQGTGPILALVGKLGPGYLSANDGIVRLHSGQVFAIALGTITTLIYQWAGRYSYPALVYALLYMMATCWCLSALAFFFDRFRFPLLWTIILLSAITTNVSQSDHFYRVLKGENSI